MSTKAPDVYYHKDKYWILDGSQERYIALSDTHITRRLKSIGLSGDSMKGHLSEIDVIKDDAVYKNTMDFVGVVAGRSVGVNTDKNGKRYLIPSKNQRVDAREGDFTYIRQILEGMLKEQLDYLYSWLHRSRSQLIEGDYKQGHILALAGQSNCGKSLSANAIIQPLLGKSGDPQKYLTGETVFNADLVASEVLIMDDKHGKRSAEARALLGQNLKWIAAGSNSVPCHPKGIDSYSVNPLWRCVICMNDDDQALGAFPPLGEGDCDSIGDKVLLLKCYKEIPLPFEGDNDQSTKLAAAIIRELPAFAHFLDNYQIPDRIKSGSSRFGFNEFHNQELRGAINQNSNERTLLSATDEVFFNEGCDGGIVLDPSTQRYYWEGTAMEWSNLLRKNMKFGPQRTIDANLSYGDSARAAGKWMGKMEKIADGRIIKIKTSTERRWKIWAPIDEELNESEGLF